MEDLIVVGAGGFGREVLQYARDAFGASRRLKGFLDDRITSLRTFDIDLPVLGHVRDHEPAESEGFLLAIGDPGVRSALYETLAPRGARFVTLVHPTAYVAPTARLEAGCIVAPFAFVAPHASLATGVVLNTYASVGHDASVGAFATFSPYAVVNGFATLGRRVFLGTHASVLASVRIGESSKVAAGSVVYRDVEANALAVGNPARARALGAAER